MEKEALNESSVVGHETRVESFGLCTWIFLIAVLCVYAAVGGAAARTRLLNATCV